jgi:hypothetical protein
MSLIEIKRRPGQLEHDRFALAFAPRARRDPA